MSDPKGWKILWLWIPVISFALIIAAEIFLPREYYGYIVEENGILEILHFLTMTIGCVIAMRAFLNLEHRNQKLLRFWFGVAVFSCLYVAGEEVSWGQQFFSWSTPDFWLHINDQQETNLHNTSSWLDQKPRLLLELGVIIGGLGLPLLSRFAPELIPAWLKLLKPPTALALCAFIALVVKIADKIGDATGQALFGRGSEVLEFYIFYFVMAYLYWLARQVRRQ